MLRSDPGHGYTHFVRIIYLNFALIKHITTSLYLRPVTNGLWTWQRPLAWMAEL